MGLKSPVRDIRTINKLLGGAEAEAQRKGESLPGAEHLLLAALALPEGSARRAFERVGADPDRLADAIAAQHADALRAIGIQAPEDSALDAAPGDAATAPGVYRSNASARSAFQAASALAQSKPSSPLAGAHVVAAVAEMEHGTVVRALRVMGVDRAALVAAAREEARTKRS